jgi:hypothetical protein
MNNKHIFHPFFIFIFSLLNTISFIFQNLSVQPNDVFLRQLQVSLYVLLSSSLFDRRRASRRMASIFS